MFRERRTKIRITAKSRTPISLWPLPVLKRNRSNTGLNRFGEIASISTTVAMMLVMMRFRRETARRRYLRTAATNRAAAKAPPRNPLHQIVGREDVDRVPVHGGPPVLVVHGADHHDGRPGGIDRDDRRLRTCASVHSGPGPRGDSRRGRFERRPPFHDRPVGGTE